MKKCKCIHPQIVFSCCEIFCAINIYSYFNFVISVTNLYRHLYLICFRKHEDLRFNNLFHYVFSFAVLMDAISILRIVPH